MKYQKHDKEGDAWIVIEGKVYNISKFVDEHPGGYIILDGAGKDATKLFTEEFIHSDSARELLPGMYLGDLEI